MSELSTPEVITMGTVALMALKMASDVIKARRLHNGHGEPTRAKVRKEDAYEFYELSSSIKQLQIDTLRSIDELKADVKDIRSEILHPEVSNHHRQRS